MKHVDQNASMKTLTNATKSKLKLTTPTVEHLAQRYFKKYI
jgi:hypothetical protein